MIHPNVETEIKDYTEIDELSGKLKKDNIDDKLMNSVLENDKDKIDEGKTIRNILVEEKLFTKAEIDELVKRIDKLYAEIRNLSHNLDPENIADIEFSQFFSFVDVDGFIYGFDIVSLYNLIIKSRDKTTNPYNRNKLLPCVIENMNRYLKLSKLLGRVVSVDIQNEINTSFTHTHTDACAAVLQLPPDFGELDGLVKNFRAAKIQF